MTRRQFTKISKALADPRRFEILERIARCSKETTCASLKKKVAISPATLSHHLKELANAGLIAARHESKFMHLRLRQEVWDAYLEHLKKIGH